MDKQEIIRLLQAKKRTQDELFSVARKLREEKYGKGVFIRGVVEVSNICENNCGYCGMRKDNNKLTRYIMQPKEILEVARKVKKAGVNILFLQSGETPLTTGIISEAVQQVKRELDMDIVLCLGDKSEEEYKRLREAGADGYILKHETCDLALHGQLRHSRLETRLQHFQCLKDLGFKVGGGNIVGLPGQTIESIAEDIELSKGLRVDYISASPFIPHENSPLKDASAGNGNLTLNVMALMRVLLNVPIPTVSALDLVKEDGQYLGFEAGANVITVNFTPKKYRCEYSLYSRKRPNKSLNEIKEMIEKAELKIAERGYL